MIFIGLYIIEVSFEKTGFQNPDSSHAVVLTPKKAKVNLTVTEQTLEWATSALKVVVQKKPFQLKFYRGKQLITSEAAGYFETKGKQQRRSQFFLEWQKTLEANGVSLLGDFFGVQMFIAWKGGGEIHCVSNTIRVPVIK